MSETKKFIIKNIDKETYFVSDAKGKIVHAKDINKACCFFDEDDAESVNEGLNSKSKFCYQLIKL